METKARTRERELQNSFKNFPSFSLLQDENVVATAVNMICVCVDFGKNFWNLRKSATWWW